MPDVFRRLSPIAQRSNLDTVVRAEGGKRLCQSFYECESPKFVGLSRNL